MKHGSLPFNTIITWALVILVGLIAIKGLPFVVDTAKTLVKGVEPKDPEEVKCTAKESHFWCKTALKNTDGSAKGDCILIGKAGDKNEWCDPAHYKPVKYTQGEYDVCRENCKIDYCPAGTGRVNNKCVACKHEGESCEGGIVFGIGNQGSCCAPELMDCKGKTWLGVGAGSCTPKATYKKS
jgi:hypothetical protein